MDEYQDLDTYNCDVVHDITVDYDRHMNTDEVTVLFDEPDLDDVVANLNDWD